MSRVACAPSSSSRGLFRVVIWTCACPARRKCCTQIEAVSCDLHLNWQTALEFLRLHPDVGSVDHEPCPGSAHGVESPEELSTKELGPRCRFDCERARPSPLVMVNSQRFSHYGPGLSKTSRSFGVSAPSSWHNCVCGAALQHQTSRVRPPA